MKRGNRGQIWVETVIYTLIAFSMISLVLAFAEPRIQQIQDKGLLDQSASMMENINDIINTLGSPGNQRVVEIQINKGTFGIDGANNRLTFQMQSSYQYSQPGIDVPVGNLVAHTTALGNSNDVNFTLTYTNYDIQYQEQNQLRLLTQSTTPYKLLISNTGLDAQNKTIVNFQVVS